MLSHLTSRPGRIGAIVAFTLVAAVGIPAAPALAATGEGCPNEAVRSESNTNPTTGQPYSMGLPECRAYEMVSPLYKQAHDAILGPGEPVAPDGDAVGFASLGAFAGFEGVNAKNGTPYLSQRTDSSWLTQAVSVPASVIVAPGAAKEGGLDYSPDLSKQVTCAPPGPGVPFPPAVTCAVREGASSWVATPTYQDLAPASDDGGVIKSRVGSSSNLSHVIFQAIDGVHLLPTDTDTYEGEKGGASIYEIVGAGTGTPVLRLVNVDDAGDVIGPENPTYIGGSGNEGTDYHAISEDGSKVFFTATPAGGVQTVYARVELPGEQYETLALSNPLPSQCTSCSTMPQPATYQGASANGAKIFFTTTQQLVNADTDTTTDLYEYDFAKPEGERIVQVSSGGAGDSTLGAGADVQGVVNISSDGSHVYFVARGLLTTTPNGEAQTAHSGADNMYVFDTLTGETKFVAQLCSGPEGSGEDADTQCGTNLNAYEQIESIGGEYVPPVNDLALWDIPAGESNSFPAQTTPDGEYLIFKTYAHLASADTNSGTAVYRYDFQTGELTWVSHAAPGFAAVDEGDGAKVGARYQDLVEFGDHADVDDLERQISEDGEDIVFTTNERLQADDVNHAQDAYLWHDGTVSMVSDGQDPIGADISLSKLTGSSEPSLSASGSDIFFSTHTALVGQDTDELGDVYDARIDGGFPAPTPEPSCAGEACLGSPSSLPTFPAPGTVGFTGGGNLTPGSTTFPPPTEAGKMSIAKHSFRGSAVVLYVKVPASGHIRASGRGLASVKRSVSKAGTYALKLTLTKADKASLREHHRVKVRIKVTFTPTSGKPSSVTTTITVKRFKYRKMKD